MTTIQTVTPEQIQQLRTEAGAAGDSAQVALCKQALEHLERTAHGFEPDMADWAQVDDERALAKCVAAINAAKAMQEPERAPTAFDRYLDERRQSPEFEREYQAELRRLGK